MQYLNDVTIIRWQYGCRTLTIRNNPNLTKLYFHNSRSIITNILDNPNLSFAQIMDYEGDVLNFTNNSKITALILMMVLFGEVYINDNINLISVWVEGESLIRADLRNNPNLSSFIFSESKW